uniref:Cytochrome b-245 light chain n=1 Tax=Arion vulgaris TaxID=1028688 RepID=A0A0B7BG76_9EUPU
MGKIEWAMWANENAIASSLVLILGGILAVCGQFQFWEIGAYAISVGVLTFLLEYPRGKRQKGTSHERQFQYPLTVVISKGRLLTRNYFIRFVAYLVLCVPCCFILQTVLGAMCYMFTSFIYLVAGIKGEEWTPFIAKETEQGPTIIEEPRHPPPRKPNHTATHTETNRNRL